jgi:putative ABC transport system permease protein
MMHGALNNMNTTFRKSLKDLMIHPWRTALVIASLVIGIWGIGSVIVTYTILRNDLNENFLRTSPAHAVLISDDFPGIDPERILKLPGIESCVLRVGSIQRIEVHPNEWVPLLLFGVENFREFRMARIYNQKGKVIPNQGTMLIERNGKLISDIDTGSTVRVRIGGQSRNIQVSGICFDPAQAPATQDHMIYAYTDKKTFGEITGEKPNRRLLLRVKDARSKADVTHTVSSLVTELGKEGITVTDVKIPKFNEHPHQWQLNVLIMMQGIIGFLGFFMGIVLVSQLMSSILSRQIRQIGILKAIGASRAQVFRIYLVMIIIMGVIAGIIAIPLAIQTGFAFAYFVAMKLNFEILTTQVSHVVAFTLLAGSVILPILVSLPSIMRGLSIPVQQAIGEYGITAGKTSSVSRKRTAVSRSFALAFRNTMRRKKRLAVTVSAMALGVAIFSTGFNMRQSLWMFLENVKSAMRYDIQVVFKNPLPQEKAISAFTDLPNVQYVETWNGGRGMMQTNVISAGDGIGIIALPYNSSLAHLKIAEGRWFTRSTEPEIVMNQQAQDRYTDASVGKYVDLAIGGKNMRAKLVGIAEELDLPKIYMDDRQYDDFANPGHLVNSLMFVAKDNRYEKVIALKTEIEKIIDGTDFNIMYVMSQAERVKIIYDHLNIILMTLVIFAFLVLIVSAFGMASATSISIMERTREIGVLRAVGATPKMIYNLFVIEGMIVSVASIILGLIVSWPLSAGASYVFGNLMLGEGALLTQAFSPAGLVVTIAATGLFGWLACRIPARNALKVSTHEALSYE